MILTKFKLEWIVKLKYMDNYALIVKLNYLHNNTNILKSKHRKYTEAQNTENTLKLKLLFKLHFS